MIIDSNLYWIPEELFTDRELQEKLLSVIPARYGWYAHVEEVSGTGKKQFVFEKPLGAPNLNYLQGDYVLETQLADMDKAGVDKAVMKTPGCQEWLDLELCRYFNTKAAEHAAKSGGRLIPMAVVPPFGKTPEEIADIQAELERCFREFGMKSVQLSCHYGDKYLDDDKFAPLFEKLNELKMTAYVHHTPVPVEYESFTTYNNVRRSYGRVVDQGLAVNRELYGGLFTKYPNVRLVHSFLGGAYYAIAEMMMPHGPAKPQEVSRFQTENTDIRRQFKENIYFEMSHAQPWGKRGLEFAVEMLGADHIVFGSSYPVRREWLLEGPSFIKALEISGEEKDLILGKNAERLYGIC